MKPVAFIFAFLLLQFNQITYAQEWRLFSASDAVTEMAQYHNHMWTISGSGLSKVNRQTGEVTIWNTVNSNLPHYNCHVMAIDSSGIVWLAFEISSSGTGPSILVKFNGVAFETISEINGNPIYHISDIIVAPDGKVWMYMRAGGSKVFVYDQNQFLPVDPPSTDYQFGTYESNLGTDSHSHLWIVLTDTLSDQNVLGEYDGIQWTIHDVSAFDNKPEIWDKWAHDDLGNVYLFMDGHINPFELIRYDGIQWSEVPLPESAEDVQYIEHPIYVDNQNRVWLSLATNKMLRYESNTWIEINLNDFGFHNGQPDKFLEDEEGHWWLMYDHYDDSYSIRSFYHFDGIKAQMINLSNSEIPSNIVNNILVDELNNKWTSTRRSLIKYNGNEWISFYAPDESIYPWPIGSNRNGGVWLFPYEYHITQFDGLDFNKTLLFDSNGLPIEDITGYIVDQKGRFLLANWETNVIVYDHGQTLYLDSIRYEYEPGLFFTDHAYDVASDSSDQIYAIGNNLYRMEADSTWTTIPLWDSWAHGFEIHISPDNEIWALDISGSPSQVKYWIYDGVQWEEVESADQLGWEPKWDRNGNPWFTSGAGLCKYEMGEWYCYDRTNSPIIPDRIGRIDIDQHNNIWITQRNGGLLVFNEDHIQGTMSEEGPLLSGYIYRDVNQNGIKDDTDTPLGSQNALLLPSNAIAYSNSSGGYRFSASEGDYEIKYLPRPNWQIDNSPSSYNVTVESDTVSGLDFNLVPDQEITDLQLYLTEGFPRCGQSSTYWLILKNNGTMAATGEITFVKDPNAEIVSVLPSPLSISGDTLRWSFTELYPFQSEQISLQILIPVLPGDSLTWSGSLDILANEMYQRIDSFYFKQEIRCAYDPNDKIARTIRSAGDGTSYLDDPLLYTIRFQNTGNDTAFNVIIRDTLDIDLDENTLDILSASHGYEAYLKPDRTLEFRFMNILLPDSTTNEMDSHGFVTYSIKAKKELASPTIIENTAHIYFDFNKAIITNTAVNELVEFGTGIFDEPRLVSLLNAHPNPTSDILYIQALAVNPAAINFSLITAQGQVLQTGQLLPGEITQLSIVDYPAGIYILRAGDSKGVQSITIAKG
jgi:uncharacterized repeat protein (TIGR01451 family)